jgi:hypothetical protein
MPVFVDNAQDGEQGGWQCDATVNFFFFHWWSLMPTFHLDMPCGRDGQVCGPGESRRPLLQLVG